MRDRFVVRLIWLTLAAALLMQLWQGGLDPLGWLGFRPEASPRVVTARGELAPDEKANIELFENARDSVVFISTRAEVLDFWTRAFHEARALDLSGMIKATL